MKKESVIMQNKARKNPASPVCGLRGLRLLRYFQRLLNFVEIPGVILFLLVDYVPWRTWPILQNSLTISSPDRFKLAELTIEKNLFSWPLNLWKEEETIDFIVTGTANVSVSRV